MLTSIVLQHRVQIDSCSSNSCSPLPEVSFSFCCVGTYHLAHSRKFQFLKRKWIIVITAYYLRSQ